MPDPSHLPHHADPASDPPAHDPASQWLRVLDILLACVAIAMFAMPAALALICGRLHAEELADRHRRRFYRWHIILPDHWAGRLLRRSGAGSCLALLNIVKGQMAFVGPRLARIGPHPTQHPELARLRPGLFSIWTLRTRTGTAFSSEEEADLEYLHRRGLRHDLGLLLRCMLAACLPSAGAALHPRVRVGRTWFDNIDLREAVSRIERMLGSVRTHQVCFINPACVNIAARHRGYRHTLARAALVLPDGIGLKVAADMLGKPLKQNVNGTDLFPELCSMLDAHGASVFLLGGAPGIARQVADTVRQRWPSIRIAGVRDGFFSIAQEGEVVEQVRSSQADLLLVARGVPTQDIFIDRHVHQLGVGVAMGVGGLFDFVSGRIPRAPQWMRDTGLEWVYRLMQEPGRMWRRYLIGNVTFMTRILLQRAGWTPKAAEQTAPAHAAAPRSYPLRVVLFATACAPGDVPLPAHYPAALLPLGQSSFIETALSQLAGAGVKAVDLVVCDHPEKIRALLDEGQRWGMLIRWHVVKDASRPYGLLGSLDLEGDERIVLAHAHCHIDQNALGMLLAHASQADTRILAFVDAAEGIRWTGWASMTPAIACALRPHQNEKALGDTLCSHTAQIRLVDSSCCKRARNAVELLACQAPFFANVPATWVRTPWGAHSPDARIEPGALMLAPALVGPGCLVQAGAQVGPNAVLASDVIVSADATVSDSILLTGTFVGRGLALERAIVNGGTVQHVALGVRTVLPPSDGLLLNVLQTGARRTRLPGRVIAGFACLLMTPCVAVDTLVLRLRSRPLRWTREQVVASQDDDSADVVLGPMRRARPGQRGLGGLCAQYGEWLDIAAGRMAWLGVHARSRSEWYALDREWQALLRNAPVGYWQLSAWDEGQGKNFEAQAAADAFFAIERSRIERVRLYLSALRNAAKPQR